MYCIYTPSTLENCKILSNRSRNGGGVYCFRASTTLMNCTIYGNRASYDGGGVFCRDSAPLLTNCNISFNVAGYNGYGIYSYRFAHPKLTNCLIAMNGSAYVSNGVYCTDIAYSTLINCTITGNPYGPSVCCVDFSSSSKLMNCILSDGLEGAGSFSTKYCCGWDIWSGPGNVVGDPQLVDPENGDFRLLSDSPCIDAGNPDSGFNDACFPPGLGSLRNDIGAYGGLEIVADTGNADTHTDPNANVLLYSDSDRDYHPDANDNPNSDLNLHADFAARLSKSLVVGWIRASSYAREIRRGISPLKIGFLCGFPLTATHIPLNILNQGEKGRDEE